MTSDSHVTRDSHATRVLVEVTDTIGIDFTTGIQRVVRETINGLQGPAGEGLEVVPIVKPTAESDFRTLTDDERLRLRAHPAGGRAGRRADDFGRLSPLVRVVGDLPVTIKVRGGLAARRRKRREFMPQQLELALGPVGPGDVFLDLEGSWYDPSPRSTLLPELRAQGVACMPLIHDVMPIIHPQWFNSEHIKVFSDWLTAHLRHSDRFLTNSQRTAEDLARVAPQLGVDRVLDIVPVPLGADYPVAEPTAVELPDGMDRYLLVVGTLEPRKNQRLVLDAFDRLRGEHPDLGLVLVGKEGWLVDDLVRRIRNHPELDRRLLWLGGIDDAQLAWLYANAFLTVTPSQYEGLGVPVMEALDRGCATLSSSGGALPEAAQGAAEMFEPDDVDELTRLIALHLDDAQHHQRAIERARTYSSPSWTTTATAVAAEIRRLVDGGTSAS